MIHDYLTPRKHGDTFIAALRRVLKLFALGAGGIQGMQRRLSVRSLGK